MNWSTRFSFAPRFRAVLAGLALLGFCVPGTQAQVTSPSGYNLGTVNLGSNASTAVTFTFTGSVTVGSVSVVTQGTTWLDFQPTSPDTSTTLCTAKTYSSGNSCTVDITFAPLSPGKRLGAAVLRNSTNQVIGTAYVSGIGSGAQLGFTAPTVSTFVGTGNATLTNPVGSSGTSASFLIPWQLAFDAAGNMYLDDEVAETIYKVTPAGLVSSIIGKYRANCGSNYTCGYPTSNSTTLAVNSNIYLPWSIVVDGAGLLWFTDNSVAGLATVDLGTGYVTAQIPGNGNSVGAPHTSGNIHSLGISSLGALNAIATDGLGNMYVSCFFDGSQTTSYSMIAKLDPSGNISIVAGNTTPWNGHAAPADGTAATSAVLGGPTSLAFDSVGNMYLYDSLYHQVFQIDTAGKMHPFAGSGSIASDNTSGLPYWQSGTASTTANTAVNFAAKVGYITVDPSGNVYVPSSPANPFDSTSIASRVFVFTPSGYAYALAGSGAIGEVNGAVTSSQLAGPTSVAVSGAGDIYVSENNIRRDQNSPAVYIGSSVRKWSMAGSSLNFGSQAKGSTSAGQTVTVTNLGNAPMVLTTPTPGTSPLASSGFTLLPNSATNSCGTGSSGAVAVYSSCSVIPAFEPNVASGTVTGTLTFTGNVGSATAALPLSGTATTGVASLKLTGLPASTTAGTSNTVTISAYDGSSNPFTGYTGTVSFSLSPADVSAALPASYTFNGSEGGTKTFFVALSAPGAHTVAVADTANSLSASQNTTVAPAIDHLAFTAGPPTTATAGVSFNVTVTAYSSSGTTVATNYTGPIKFTSSDSNAVFPTGTALNMTSGVGTYTITLKTAGNQTLSVADSSGSPSTSSSMIAVSAGAATTVSASSGSVQSAIIGNTFTNALVVQTFDAYSNPVGGVTVSFAGPGTGASATFSASSCVTSATATPAGSCSVIATANATAGTNYSVIASSGSLSSATFTLTNNAKTAQTITFNNPGTQTFGTTPTLTATSASSLTVAFSSTTTGVCSVTSGGALTFLTAGTCTINADQAGNSTYAVATTVLRSFTVNAVVPGAPTIGTASGANSQATISFAAPVNTGGATITGYTVTSSPGGRTGTGSASPIAVTGLTNGTTYTFTVTAANSAGTGAASAASNSVVPSGAQTITFNNPGTQTYGTTPTLTATDSSGLAVVFTSTTTGVCTVTSGGFLSFVSTGTCSINADQAGNGSYNAATTVTQGFSVQAASQTITFTQPTSPVTYGVSPVTLTATGGASGNAVTFSVISGPGTVSGSTLTVTGAGTIVVAADQLGNSNYSAATEVQRGIVVNAASQTITFTQPTSPVTFGVSPISLTATGGGSGNAVTFSVISGPGMVSGSTLTVTGAGTFVVAADQAGNTNYAAATEVQRSIVVNAASQTITFTQPSTPMTYGSATTVALSATGGALGNAVTFTIASGPGTISGSTLTITGAGTIVISANQVASGNYAAATQVQRSLVVSTAASTLTGPATQPVFVVFSQSGTVPVTIAGQYSGTGIAAPGTGTTGNTISYSIVNSSSTSVASGSLTIASGAVSVPVASTLAPGLYTVNASYAGDTNYSAATSITINLQVGQIQPVATITAPLTALTYGSALGIAATATYNGSAVAGSFVYTATPTGGAATAVTATTILPAGSYLLTANFTPTDAVTYKTATTTAPLTVNKATPGVTLTSSVNPLLVQNATMLTATVSSAVSTPSGSVTFYDNTASAAIGAAVPLTNGVATVSVSTLSVGTHTITAIYSGDTNFVTFTSTAVSEQVDDFSLAISTSASSSTSQTILPGGTATFSFTLSPTGTTTFPAAVNLTVTGLPTGATYTITPSILAAGSGSTPVTLTITAPKQTAMLHTGEKLAPFALALLLLPFGGRMRRRAGKLSKLVALFLLIVGGAASMATLTGCGSTTGFFASPQQTYNVTITGTSGALSHSTTVNLTVE